jgi:3-oxoacyl-ACP reductase-like protein
MAKKKKIAEEANGMIQEVTSEATASTTKKTLIQELEEMKASGLVGTPEFTDKMREMEVLLGVSEISPFGTNELEIFEQNLAEMSLSDMQKLALKIGTNPYHEKPILKQSLIREFTAYTRNSRRNIMPAAVQSFVIDHNNPKHKELLKLLDN